MRALATYDVEVVAAPGTPPFTSVRVIFSAIGEIAASGAAIGVIRALVRGVDPVSGNTVGSTIWDWLPPARASEKCRSNVGARAETIACARITTQV